MLPGKTSSRSGSVVPSDHWLNRSRRFLHFHATCLSSETHRESRRGELAALGYLQPSCAIPTGCSLSADSFRARRMLLTPESGRKAIDVVRLRITAARRRAIEGEG